MKILTKEEEEANYNAALKGGFIGGGLGVAAGLAGVTLGSMRFPVIRHLTLPMKAFLVTSAGTFAAITSADSASRNFEKTRHPEEQYKDDAAKALARNRANQSTSQRITEWAREHRYHIVGGSWAGSMVLAFALVSRSPLSTAQKLVQARVYAQGLTLAVLLATAAFEISDQKKGEGRYETIQTYDPNDPTHTKMIEKRIHKEEYEGEDQWKDMIAAEEQRLKQKNQELKEYEAEHHKTPHKTHKKDSKQDNDKSAKSDKSDKKDDSKQDKKDDSKQDKKDSKKESKKDDEAAKNGEKKSKN